MLDNPPLYTIGRRGDLNLLVSLYSKNQAGDVILDDSVVLDVNLGLAKRRLMAIKEADPDGTRDCVIVQVVVSKTGKIVYDPEPPVEVDKSHQENVPNDVPPKQEPVEIKEEKKLSFLEKLKKILF